MLFFKSRLVLFFFVPQNSPVTLQIRVTKPASVASRRENPAPIIRFQYSPIEQRHPCERNVFLDRGRDCDLLIMSAFSKQNKTSAWKKKKAHFNNSSVVSEQKPEVRGFLLVSRAAVDKSAWSPQCKSVFGEKSHWCAVRSERLKRRWARRRLKALK